MSSQLSADSADNCELIRGGSGFATGADLGGGVVVVDDRRRVVEGSRPSISQGRKIALPRTEAGSGTQRRT